MAGVAVAAAVAASGDEPINQFTVTAEAAICRNGGAACCLKLGGRMVFMQRSIGTVM